MFIVVYLLCINCKNQYVSKHAQTSVALLNVTVRDCVYQAWGIVLPDLKHSLIQNKSFEIQAILHTFPTYQHLVVNKGLGQAEVL